jgi:hypothetical protein
MMPGALIRAHHRSCDTAELEKVVYLHLGDRSLQGSGLAHEAAVTLPLFYFPCNQCTMNKLLSLIFLVGGIVLIVYGVNAADSLSSDFSRFFTGSATNKSIWLLIGGVVAAAVGLFGLVRKTSA